MRLRSIAVLALAVGVAGLGVALLMDVGDVGDAGDAAPGRAPAGGRAGATPGGSAAALDGERPRPPPARVPIRRPAAEVETTAAPRLPRAPVVAPGFELARSGLQIRDDVVGSGPSPRPGQTVLVHYTGWLEDGDRTTPFDDSRVRGAPTELRFGRGTLIRGFEEALATMAAGGKRTIIVPAGLAYGDAGAGSAIPPGATLRFELELVEIKDPRGEAEAPP